VFAPAGIVLTAVEDLPEFAAKGRSRLTTQIRNARIVGEFAVNRGGRHLRRRMAGEAVPRPHRPAAPAPAEEPGGPPSPAADPTPRTAHNGRPAGAGVSAPGAPGGPVDLAIPDYAALSASQVVRRLDGLVPAELQAVYRHEAATRRRRTILHRAQQLLGTEELPGVGDPGT